MDEAKRCGGCSTAAAAVFRILFGILGLPVAVIRLALGALWFHVKCPPAPFTPAHSLLKGGARRRNVQPSED